MSKQGGTMFMPYNNIIFSNTIGNNEYITYELSYLKNQEEYLQYILPVLREEYGLGSRIDDLENLNRERKEKLRKILAKHITPNPQKVTDGRGSQLKITRGKIGEVMAKDLLKKKYKVEFSGRISKEEEAPNMPKKGIDNFGFIFKENSGEIEVEQIVVCEVKASSSKKSPPAVVHSNEDSMYKELLRLKTFDERMMTAIVQAFDRFSVTKYCEIISELLLAIEESDDLASFEKKVLVVPFLLRTSDTYTEDDFGKFVSKASEFGESTIKYYIVVIDTPIENFADSIYEELRKEG